MLLGHDYQNLASISLAKHNYEYKRQVRALVQRRKVSLLNTAALLN